MMVYVLRGGSVWRFVYVDYQWRTQAESLFGSTGKYYEIISHPSDGVDVWYRINNVETLEKMKSLLACISQTVVLDMTTTWNNVILQAVMLRITTTDILSLLWELAERGNEAGGGARKSGKDATRIQSKGKESQGKPSAYSVAYG